MKKQKLTLEEFLQLPRQEQYVVVFENGIFIERRNEKNKVFALYSLFLFFVEFEYGSQEKIIVAKYAFVSGITLDKYISFEGKKFLEEI